jgi:predicted DNA-binding ribbon-helix-helix protein
MCGKPATPPDDLGAGRKKIAVRAEPLKKLDVSRSGIRVGGMIAIPLPNIGSMGGECGPLRRRHSGKGCAVESSTDGGVFMKSLVFKRSIVVASHKTSVSLEDAFWNGLKEIAGERHMTLSDLVAAIDSQRQHGNLSSALRLFVLDFYRTQLSHVKEGCEGTHEMIGHTAPAFS